MPIAGFSQEIKQEVETHLSLIARKLATSLKTRKHDLPILEHAKEAFPFKENNLLDKNPANRTTTVAGYDADIICRPT